MRLYRFIADWILIIAIVGGILSYFVAASVPASAQTRATVLSVVQTLQPLLIFAMLFLTFCKVDLRHLRLCRYHWWLLLFQAGLYLALGAVVMSLPRDGLRIVLEGAMICFICPTATAGAVIVKKLGGSPAHITTYTILINLTASLMIPVTIPLVHPNPDMSLGNAMVLILGKVFPLLLLPLVGAWLLRQLLPKVHATVQKYGHLSFELWVVALGLATAVTTRYIMHSTTSLSTDLWLVAVSLIACVMQFWVGRKIGGHYGETITGGQSLGQKNTVLAIWLGYTFFTPVTSVVGGFYSIWHNIINSRQLYRHKHGLG
ncbi:MAG: transporter [Candidatus Amulumruptor caecigallinarius]|nr:transporter [Candidatus Amulumruptor caecigallinarius]MCM1397677.1 transporter [Candidatus Amulumruptor caecigallinarius]MCM1454694.1 transporter [bacterium]